MTITGDDPKLQQTAERFHMAMAEAGYPDVAVRVEDGAVLVSYPMSLNYNDETFQHAFYTASKLADPSAPMACFDCWYAAQHTHFDGRSCEEVGCTNSGETCEHV